MTACSVGYGRRYGGHTRQWLTPLAPLGGREVLNTMTAGMSSLNAAPRFPRSYFKADRFFGSHPQFSMSIEERPVLKHSVALQYE